jgi:DNA-binding NtrC family response regulator
MRHVYELTQLATTHDEAVVLTGETGTGKGELARWIHVHGTRAGRPFVALNCATLRGDLLSSELFGHSRGAFTSALRDRRGLVEEADGGTLFLDEIGDMDLGAQAQLLKVIEERTFRRIGETEMRASDFRLLCASHRDLLADVGAGRFRSDLYFRINVFPIEVPPLRERADDLESLTSHLLASFGAAPTRLDAAALSLLRSHPWPGNVRELRNALLRALLLARGGVLQPEHFPGIGVRSRPLITHPDLRPSPSTPIATHDDAKLRARIADAMTRHDGNRTRVARTLGMSRTTLYRHLERLGLNRTPDRVRRSGA